MPGPVPVVAVVGATATGKSQLAIDLAQRLGGEVVNTDAMQQYRGMDIGTAKVPVAERRVPHHLLDVLDVTEPASVAAFQRAARAVVAGCRSRGVVPVLAGGSALYTRAVLDDLAFPGTDPALRAELEDRLAQAGAAALHAELARVDPEAAASILPGNGRRVVRALEVVRLTGRPFRASLPPPSYADPHTVQVGLGIERDVLDRRIEARVDRMWRDGLVEEVRGLVGRGLREGRTAREALGYKQVLRFLDGETGHDDARTATVRGTRRFARRQEAWFGRDRRVVWIAWDRPGRLDAALAAVSSVSSPSSVSSVSTPSAASGPGPG